MAGFAVSVGALRAGASDGRVNGSSVPMMPYKAGHEEDLFLRAVGVPPGEVEPLADGCTRVRRAAQSLVIIQCSDNQC